MNTQIEKIASNIEKVIVGKHYVVLEVLTAMLCGGHVLIEDVPGVGKTQLVSALSRSVEGVFNRVQMTPDIMPSDITGFSMYNRDENKFEFCKGSAFCNFLLADEINRASPKAQSSLLEIMEEFQVSIDGHTYPLPQPFMVLATQNPVETYGTYHLPEAQMDRFIMKISLGYPLPQEEFDILARNEYENPVASLTPVATIEEICALQEQAKQINAVASIKQYIINIVTATRNNEFITLGASPRGSIALFKAAKAFAFIEGRDFITPDDVRRFAVPVLAHRLMLSPRGKSAFSSAENAVANIVSQIQVPVR